MNKITKRITLCATSLFIIGGVLTSCHKSDTVAAPDPIGGFNNSNEVGAASLKAHWTFDGTVNETISSTAPITNVGSSYGTGIKGQALTLTNGYLLYPVIAALNVANIGSVTVSAWIYTDNNGMHASNVFALTQGTAAQTDWNRGAVTMYLENGKPVTYDDTLVLHSAFSTYATGSRLGGDNINDYSGTREIDYKTVHGTNKWVHYVMRYDGTGSFMDVFANGINVGNIQYRYRTTGTPPVAIGPIVTTLGTQALIGAFPSVSSGFAGSPNYAWQGNFTGSIDELRFWNTALSNTDISSLYQLEKAGR